MSHGLTLIGMVRRRGSKERVEQQKLLSLEMCWQSLSAEETAR